jgi:hypothetical protein
MEHKNCVTTKIFSELQRSYTKRQQTVTMPKQPFCSFLKESF